MKGHVAASVVGAALVAASVGFTVGAGRVEAASVEAASVEVEGAWEHPSGMTFPERVAGFARVAVRRLAASGGDAAAGPEGVPTGGESPAAPGTRRVHYRLRDGTETLAEVTAAVHPRAGQALEERFGAVVAAVGVELGSAPRRREATAVDQAAGMANGLAAHWSYAGELGGRRRELESRVLLFRRGEWFVEYRVRFAAAARGRAELEIDELLRSLAMPAG
jgi:hypothetical protein